MPPYIKAIKSSDNLAQQFLLTIKVVDSVLQRNPLLPGGQTIYKGISRGPLMYQLQASWDLTHFQVVQDSGVTPAPVDIAQNTQTNRVEVTWNVAEGQTYPQFVISMVATLPPKDPNVPSMDFKVTGIMMKNGNITDTDVYHHYDT